MANPLSRFLESFPTQVECSKSDRRRVFWSQHQSMDYDDDNMIHEKIKSAFGDANLSPLKGILQFWAPRDGRRLLSTCDQPFTLAHLNSLRRKYRLTCINYEYNIDNTTINDDPMIISGPVATAFFNRFPIVFDLTLQQDNPLVRAALECELTCSLLIPVFNPPTSCCVGVVECSVKLSGLSIFNYLKLALEKVGLSTYHAPEFHPYKNICGLGLAKNEIEATFEFVCESHDLTLAQVWVPFQNVNHLPFTETKLVFAVRLIGYRDLSYDHWSFIKNYYDTCDMLPLKSGEGLAGKTIQTHEPYFCQDVSKMTHNGLLGLLSADTKCSSFTICLRSTHSGDLDYVFEFLWPRKRNCFLVLDTLLPTLKSCLPSFKFPCGAQLGDELRVLDVDNSTGSGTGYFKTQKITNFNGETYIGDEAEEGEHDDDVFLVASFEEINRLFKFPSSSTLAYVKEEIHERYNLDPGTCRLEFRCDDGKWKRLDNDDDFASCVVWRKSQIDPVIVRMLPCTF